MSVMQNDIKPFLVNVQLETESSKADVVSPPISPSFLPFISTAFTPLLPPPTSPS